VDDWRYNFLREDIKRLRDDLSEVERRPRDRAARERVAADMDAVAADQPE
jgi:uncharacterized protein YydD (DUF2326 family)